MPDPTPPQPHHPPPAPVHVNTGGAPAIVPNGGKWHFDLPDRWRGLANMSILGVFVVLFLVIAKMGLNQFVAYQQDALERAATLQQLQLDQAREDRKMFRDELRVMHDDSRRKWEAINQNQRAVVDMTADVKRLTTTVSDSQRVGLAAATELANTMKVLIEETKKLQSATERRTDQERRKPPPDGGAFRGPGGVLPAASHPTIRALGERP